MTSIVYSLYSKYIHSLATFLNPYYILPTLGSQVCAVWSGPRAYGRVVKSARTEAFDAETSFAVDTVARCELDTRADTICCGMNFRPLAFTGQLCEVRGFHDSLQPMKDIPVARCATAYTHPATGTTYILVFNEALYFGKSMDHSLINPNQVRSFGIPVSDNPFDTGRPFGIDHEDLFVSFRTEGSTVCFDTRVPSDDELESCKFVKLTDGDTEWNPHEVDMSSNRHAGGYDSVKHLAAVSVSADQRSYGETDAVLNSISMGLAPHTATTIAIESVNVETSHYVASASSTTQHSSVTPERVSRLFGVGLNKAKDLLRVTTQRGVRTAVHPITRRYRVDHLDLHTNRLQGQWFCDWMVSSVKSLSQNTGAFVFTNGRYTEVYPKESHTHTSAAEALDEFIQDVGIPVNLRTDMASEFTGRNSEFVKLARKWSIRLTYQEAGQSNQLWYVDLEIRELKKRWHQIMVHKQIHKKSLGLRLEACSVSHATDP